jgi:Cys-tRNA synthase (O-phospho-L-seryl-tRNA:Cys-tRNA synthase)
LSQLGEIAGAYQAKATDFDTGQLSVDDKTAHRFIARPQTRGGFLYPEQRIAVGEWGGGIHCCAFFF